MAMNPPSLLPSFLPRGQMHFSFLGLFNVNASIITTISFQIPHDTLSAMPPAPSLQKGGIAIERKQEALAFRWLVTL